ncbi:C40 family peptidase [Agromyces laixinhei]|uniref:C40 family peptidase n=1 Tax=Agromyces laixinhei TaxID=2585717 RepID=UPI0012EDB717|nr:C40 family peptidase [Agromyces laixinhei]
MKPATIFSAVAVGAVTASVVAAGGPAMAEPDYPSWSEIEQAKSNEATKQAEIARVGELLVGLQQAADAAVQASQMAAESYRIAADQRDQAAEREQTLARQAGEADAVAEISKMRAGLLAAHIAKAGGNDLSSELVFAGDGADGLLKQLGMATKLGEQSQAVYEQAIADRNTADSLRAQATEAAAERARLAALAEAKATEANAAAESAMAAVTAQEQRSAELYAQLATLKDTTAELERERVEGQAREAAMAALEASRPSTPAPPSGGTGGDGGSSGGSGGSTPAPNPDPAPPNASAVETAIWFASQQLGEPYRLGGAGPDEWDCSGLTRAAYSAAGIGIGTHSATNQYHTLAGRGKAVPLGSVQRGDLLFWGSSGNYYHVAIYLGGGRILEAPDYGKPVREWPIWGSPSAAARPAG